MQSEETIDSCFDWLNSNIDTIKDVVNNISDLEFLYIINDIETDGQQRVVIVELLYRRMKDVKFELNGFDLSLIDKLLNSVPWYNPEITKEVFTIEMRDLIYERDDNECRLCHSFWNGLICHHIEPQGKATEDNLITLCLKCHEIIHRLLKNKGYPYTIPGRYGYR